MCWMAPSEKDNGEHLIGKRVVTAAAQFRAIQDLNAARYSQPVLGLIFLRFAEVLFLHAVGRPGWLNGNRS
jgi:type I restriction enzyme M protein